MFGRLLIPAMVAAGLVCPAYAQVDEGAKSRLVAASEAIKSTSALAFKAKVTATGTISGMMPTGEGKVTMLREKNTTGGADVWLVHVAGSGQGKAKDPVSPFEVAWLNGQSRVTDYVGKKVLQTPGKPRPGPGYRAAESLKINELVEAEPLKKALNSPNITLLESAEVAGVACDVVETGSGKGTKERFFISKEDNLPRKIVRVFENSMMSGDWVTEISDLTKPTDLKPEALAFPVPEGFTEEKVTPPATATPKNAEVPASGAVPKGGDASLPMTHPAQATPADEHVTARTPAPEFELADATGKKVSLSSLRGNVVLLDFWGTWCIPCRASHKELAAMEEGFKDKPVKVLSLAVREKSKDAPIEYMKKNNYTFGLLLDADPVAEQYHVKAYPTFVLIGQDGQVLSRFEAFKKDETIPAIKRMIEEMLTAPKKAGEGKE